MNGRSRGGVAGIEAYTGSFTGFGANDTLIGHLEVTQSVIGMGDTAG